MNPAQRAQYPLIKNIADIPWGSFKGSFKGSMDASLSQRPDYECRAKSAAFRRRLTVPRLQQLSLFPYVYDSLALSLYPKLHC